MFSPIYKLGCVFCLSLHAFLFCCNRFCLAGVALSFATDFCCISLFCCSTSSEACVTRTCPKLAQFLLPKTKGPTEPPQGMCMAVNISTWNPPSHMFPISTWKYPDLESIDFNVYNCITNYKQFKYILLDTIIVCLNLADVYVYARKGRKNIF